jgi:hypothetical protein
MKYGSTHFLRTIIVLIGLTVLALCVFALPAAILSDQTSSMYRPILFGMYVPAIPFFWALYQALKLLGYIDKNEAFSGASVTAVRYIKYCAFAISVLYTLGLPYIYHVADKDDAPGVMALGLAFAFLPFVVGVFGAVFQKLLQSGMELKAENDLTV